MSDFDSRDDGVYVLAGDEWQKVCSPLNVVALTRDRDSNNWGRELQWRDADGKPHEAVIHEASLAPGNREVLSQLRSGGLWINVRLQDSVIDYIQSELPDKRVVVVQTTGWHDDSFILPDTVIPAASGDWELRYAPTVPTGDQGYGVAGTADDWKHEVGRLCGRNSRLLYGCSMSFSAPTLEMLGEEGGGSHLHGTSSGGKTTTLVVAGSVWGGGKNGFLKSWRTTSNALENIAAAHNDCFLPVDELGQLESRDADKVAYLLAGGQSKSRMNPDASGQRQKVWRLQFLSSGEVTTAQQADSVGSKTRGGMEVRMVNVPADAGKGLGAFEDFHGMAGGAQFAVKLKEAALKYYGAVGREWVRLLATDRHEYAEMLREDIRKFEQTYMPQDAVPEVRRVVHRFAIIAAAGELATLFDLSGWDEGDATWGAATCLAAWLENRGGAKQGHDAKQMFGQVRLFIQRNQLNGFRHISENPMAGGTYRPVGYYDYTDDGKLYCLQTEIFKQDVCKGFDHLQVLRALDEAGHLVHNSNRRDYQITIASKYRQRVYAIKDSLLTSDASVED